MRRRKSDLSARVNGNLALRFTANGLTSYSGLEIFRCFLQRIGFSRRLREHLRALDPQGDFPSTCIVRLLIALLVVGGSRLRHLGFLVGDPLVERFCGLAELPTARTISRWLSRCTAVVQGALLSLNAEIVGERIRVLNLRRLTIDVDGTVISTGLQAQWANRGYNPHRRKVPSYYPITAHLAQTGQILRVKNRPGNVHDGRASMHFFRDLNAQIEETVGTDVTLEFRLDGAFFRQEIVSYLESRGEYAIKVPFYGWVGLKPLIAKRKRWKRIGPGLEAFDADIWIDAWNRSLRVAIYRKRVAHKSPKNYQLDLFDPSDGHWEYSAITTNKTVGLKALWAFMCGRGSHEKILAELKTGYAFDTVPAKNYAANSTWQILSALAHNLVTDFQIATGAAARRSTAKRSPLFVLKSIRTLRYEIFARAGILQRPAGRNTLTLAQNLPTRRQFESAHHHLAKAA